MLEITVQFRKFYLNLREFTQYLKQRLISETLISKTRKFAVLHKLESISSIFWDKHCVQNCG